MTQAAITQNLNKKKNVYVVINEWEDVDHFDGNYEEKIFNDEKEAILEFKKQVAFDKEEGLGMQADKFPEDYENDNVEDCDIVIAEDNDSRYYVFEQGYAAGNYVEITLKKMEVK